MLIILFCSWLGKSRVDHGSCDQLGLSSRDTKLSLHLGNGEACAVPIVAKEIADSDQRNSRYRIKFVDSTALVTPFNSTARISSGFGF